MVHRKGSQAKRLTTPVVLLVFSLLSCFVAFVLSLLCIFAGSKSGYLENANLLTLNTSRLGQSILQKPKGVDPDSKLGQFVGAVEGEVNGLVADIAKQLHLHDFYSVHLLDYCEGFYTPSSVANNTVHPTKNVTHCSNRTASFHFNATKVIQDELKSDISLPDLDWPSALEDGVGTAKLASKVMFVLYCLGVAATGLALVGIVVGIFARRRLMAIYNVVLTTIAFLSLALASIISSTFISKAVKLINEVGHHIGIAAYKGHTFLGMTWAATILVLFASVAWTYECIRRGRVDKMSRAANKEARPWGR
ncbi:hypothetical protein MMC07_003114 [Pseudocyphellaria aurata]|nr:hypothetical protein [Pseudocyphellaria aurata]